MSPNLIKVDVYLNYLQQDNLVAGFLGFLDWSGEMLNPKHHRKGRFGAWWTHFALLLEFGDGTKFKLERNDEHNVVFERVDDELTMAVGATKTIEWFGEKEKSHVENFVLHQKGYPYNFVGKNCQHFAYDFFRCCLGDQRAKGSFEEFTEVCQSNL
mmetsp:Transcript_6554/g.10391  ORF Transcript_6554/g.10391 Transcript_6554/m.10391 type:complete len:156 (+) Transcript_6554:72-539(+)